MAGRGGSVEGTGRGANEVDVGLRCELRNNIADELVLFRR
jgi:hypothetical protein